MKTLPAGLATHYGLRQTTLATFLELQRRDGVFARFTGASRDVPVAGNTFAMAPGLTLSNLETTGTLAVDTLEITVFPDSLDLEADLMAGRWNFAAFRLFEASYADPTLGVNSLRRGWTGEGSAARGGFRFELRSLKQALQQAQGSQTSMNCRYRLGSTARPDGLCLVDLAPWTFALTVTGVTSRTVFACSAATQPDDTFGDGSVAFESGENEGYAGVVAEFAGGVFRLKQAMPFDIGIGDTLTAVAGCRKRLLEDCRDKFANVLNFGGEPHVPGMDAITADPEIGT